jgi:N-acetyl-gamma-glutamyl-phosphate reductase
MGGMLNYANMMHNYSASQTEYKSPQMTDVSVVGARGYSGVELCKLLLKHPFAKLQSAFATGDFQLTDLILDSKAASVQCFSDTKLMENLTDVVFLATPAEVSMKLAPQIIEHGKTVIDLSGAFRLKSNDFKKWYGIMHTAPEYAQSAEYGLLPFCGPVKPTTRLISNPGCYASAISLALIPLLKSDLIHTDSLVIDAKSGTTGAGKKAAENLLFSEVSEECLPYRVGQHQHTPEIQEAVQLATGIHIDFHFTTSLLSAKRGIVAGIYAQAKTDNIQDIESAFKTVFEGYPLVRHGRDVSRYARLANVVNTPYAHISYELMGKKLYVFSCIDNLVKGAAGQAIENLNRLLDLPANYSLTMEG